MQSLSYGKINRINNCSTERNTFLILAIDHRTSLMKSLGITNDLENFSPLTYIKNEIIKSLRNNPSAIFVDPEIGLPLFLNSNKKSKNIGLIISIEKSGYDGSKYLRNGSLLTGWDIEKSSRIGTDAVKLLVYYHPEAKNVAATERLISVAIEQCNAVEVPLFLEIITYSISSGKVLQGEERTKTILDSVRKLSNLGPDFIKVQFPGDEFDRNQGKWIEACKRLNDISIKPWVLLSASIDFPIYLDQVHIACEQGCSGVAVGRAVWKEIIDMQSKSERINFLKTIATQRMKMLEEICLNKAKPWSEYYTSQDIIEKWFESY